jgi:hypothetical protein
VNTGEEASDVMLHMRLFGGAIDSMQIECHGERERE